ncbi:MAG: YhdP family protein [Methylophilaceae bacterium]
MLAIKKTFRWIIYTIILLLTLMVIAAAVIRFAIFPNIDQYKDDISAKISHKIGLKTTIGNIVTDWDGISPRISIRKLDIYNEDNISALHLENVKGTFSWLSIPMMHAHLSNISVTSPKLTIQRKENGHIFIAGIPLAGEGKPDFANWALSQASINVKDASVIWQDDLRQAPALSLNKVNLSLKNPAWRKIFGQHLFTFSATPSTGTKYPITIDGHFFGRDIAKIETWKGNANLNSKDIDLTAWKAWVDYPIDLKRGAGDAKVSLYFSKKKINKLKANIALHHLLGKINPDKKDFSADLLSGLITWEQDPKATTINARDIKLITQDKLNINNGSGLVTYYFKNDQPWINASMALDTFDLKFLKILNETATLPESFNTLLSKLSPKGQLNDLVISWIGDVKSPTKYRLKSGFKALSINTYNNIPGFKNLSGKINANEENGVLQIASTNASLDFKEVLRWPIPAKKLNGKVTWNKNKEKIKIVAKDIFIANQHISGTINASYHMNGVKGGYLNLTGSFDNGNIKYAPFYYPTTLNNQTIEWLDSSILSGKANNVQLTVKGHLDDFPYVDKKNRLNPKLGIFRVTARLSDAVLEYGKSWPKIKNLGLDLLFEGNRMELNANKGKILGFNITKSKVTIPELDTAVALSQVLNITSEGEGPITEGIKFINSSPVKEVSLGFTDDLKTAGNGKLNLDLSIPLNDIENSKYKGQFHINDGKMYENTNTGLPEISHIFGALNFDEAGINAQDIKAEMLGGPAQVSLSTASDKTINIDATGTMSGVGIQKVSTNTLTTSLEGNADWEADIAIKKPVMNLSIRSSLIGMAVNLPAPLGKPADQDASFMVTKKQTLTSEDLFEVTYNKMASAKIFRTVKNGDLTIARGDIAINTPVQHPTEPGLSLHGQFDYVNADEWLALVNKSNTGDNQSTLNLTKADLSIQKLDIFNRSLSGLKVTAKPNNNHLQMTLTSQELDGDVEWQSASSSEDNGKIIARLNKLHIPTGNEEESDVEDNEIRRLDRKYPALDIKADDFKLGKKALGTLELNAFERNEDWVIEKLKISNPSSTLLADGTWHNWTRSPNTNLKFTLSTENIGDTLKRFGQADAVKGGVAIIAGRLQWPGSPHEFKKKGLNGEFTLGASKGQILKVQPGVGRLFGLLTLQSLPRRLTLDFRDLFSEGFAFDEISATAKINNGIMRSNDFFMTGPAAETQIKGETNLETETQNLKVKVVPHISDSLSLAALAGGPLAGAAAWLAQKILKDPFNKIAQSEYTVIGTWDKPVELDAEKKDEKTKTNSPLNMQ